MANIESIYLKKNNKFSFSLNFYIIHQPIKYEKTNFTAVPDPVCILPELKREKAAKYALIARQIGSIKLIDNKAVIDVIVDTCQGLIKMGYISGSETGPQVHSKIQSMF